MQFAALPAADWPIDTVLSKFNPGTACTDGGTFDYDDGVFTGKYQLWQKCDGGNAVFVVLATNASDNTTSTYLTEVQAVTSADLDALDHILSTFDATT